MSPIRIAFIGLSANSSSGWAVGAHLPYLKQTSKYQIVALCNTSKENSEAAIKAFELSSSVKAYGSVDDLAEASDTFDLAVCSVWVDKHFDAIRPLVAKGKQCYLEWPLCKNLEQCKELQSIATKSGNPRTMICLQARRSPFVNKVRDLIAKGAIGRVLSSTVVASAGNLGQVEKEGMGKLFNDSKSHANMLTIHFAHLIDYVLYSLDHELSDLSAVVDTQRKQVKLQHDDGSFSDMTRNTPDQILLQGRLTGGAVLSIHERGGSPLKGSPGLRWRVYGEKGELEITSEGSFLQVGYDDMTVKLHDHEKDTIETVEWAANDEFESLPMPARNVARLYESFADGKTDEYVDWKGALARHQLLDSVVRSSESGTRVSIS